MVNYKINVYLKHTEMENMYVREFIELVTQDINGNNFEFTVYEDDNVYDLTNKRVTMIVKSDSGTVIQENCQVVDAKQGKATITLPPDMLIENGPYMAEVQIWEGVNSRVTTLPFDYTVRLSLENDESIKADPRFSLLQVALQNVNDADGKSKEALKLSKEAKAICDDLVPKANTAAQNAQTALDRAESVVTQEELANKIGYNGVFDDTNFDFIKNQVVNDGLLISGKNEDKDIISRNVKIGSQFILKGFHTSTQVMIKVINIAGFQVGFDTSGYPFSVGLGSDWTAYGDKDYKGEFEIIITILSETQIKVVFTTNRTVEKIRTVNRIPLDESVPIATVNLSKIEVSYFGYNRPIAPQESQHNFSVLNNPPSIKELHTTDSTGKTSILKLASSEDYVEMSTGRTLREEYMGVLKTLGKEFTSADGSSIEVNNGIEARVISNEIKGQTVRSIANVNSGFRTAVGDGTLKAVLTIPDIGLVKPSSDYTLVTEVISNTLNGDFKLVNINTSNMMTDTNDSVPAGKTGIFIVKLRSKANLSGTSQIIRHALTADSTSGSITYRSCVFEGDLTKVVKGFAPFGLVSTEAIISNNGQQYPIYEPTIQGKTRILKAPKGTQNWVEISAGEIRDTSKFDYKLDSVNGDLGSVPNVADYVDGAKKVKVANTKEAYMRDKSVTLVGTQTKTTRFRIALGEATVASSGVIATVNNMFKDINIATLANDEEGLTMYSSSNIDVKVLTSRASTVEQFKSLIANLVVRYQLATPQEIQLTEEQMKTYDAHKKVILLDVVGDKRNTLEIKEDGSAVYTQNVLKYLIDGTSKNRIRLENTSIIIDGSKGILGYSGHNDVIALLSSRLTPASWNNGYSTEGAIYMHPNGALFISNTESKTLEEVKLDLSSNPIEVIGFIPSPIITHIPKDLVTSILTHKTNILEVGGAVKPSSFKVTVPVDKLAEIEARLQALESTTVDVVLNK